MKHIAPKILKLVFQMHHLHTKYPMILSGHEENLRRLHRLREAFQIMLKNDCLR